MPSTVVQKLRLTCKCTELVLAVVCVVLGCYAPLVIFSRQSLLSITFGGFVIIASGLILGYVTCERAPKRVDLLFTVVGMVLFLAAGCVAIDYFHDIKLHTDAETLPGDAIRHLADASSTKMYKNTGLAMGAIAIINSVIFLVDALLSYKDCNNDAYTPH